MEKTRTELIYEIILKELPLTNQTLIDNGFSNKEIKDLLEQEILQTIGLNEYKLSTVDGLYNYGVKLLFLRKIKSAYLCFEKCHQLDSKNRDVCLQLMLMALKREHFHEALRLFTHLEQISETKDFYDNNLYLYMLNLLTGCPEEYTERLNNLDYDSFLIPYDIDIPNKEKHNNLRQSILKSKNRNALRLQNDIIAQNRTYSAHDELLKELIIRLINSEDRFKGKILEFAKTNRYNAIVSFIETRSKKRCLTNEETFAYLISKAMKNIIENHTIPTPTIHNTSHVYDAIKGNNFVLALKLETLVLKRYNQPTNENIVYILLSKVNELILQFQQEHIKESETQKTLVINKYPTSIE